MNVDPLMLATMTGFCGAILAAIWSFLMAYKVAAPRAKKLLIGALQGKTPDDREAIDQVRANLIRPEVLEMTRVLKAEIAGLDDRIATFRIPELDVLAARIDAVRADLGRVVFPSVDDISGAITEAISAELERLPTIDNEAVAVAIGPQISKYIDMALKQAEAQQAKRVGAFLKDAGIDAQLEDLTEGMKAEALAQAGPMAQFVADIMSAKISKNATLSERVWLTVSKAAAVQMAQTGMMGLQMPGQQAVAGPVSLSPYGP